MAEAHRTVQIRYFAAARTSAGVSEEFLQLAGDADVSAVVASAVAAHGPALGRVMARCSFLLDEVAVHGLDTAVSEGATLDVLPPFAGG